MNARPPLGGIRVVSLAQNVPGPLAVARLVAEGAEATKIEPPAGDPLAALCLPWYGELHRDVAIERLDLKSAEGQTRLMTRLARADLFVTSQRPSALGRLSLDGAALARACPRLRLLHIVGDAADPETPGHDLTYQAAVGLLRGGLPVTLTADAMAAERAVQAAVLLLRQPPGSVRVVGVRDSLDTLVAPIRHGLTATGGPLGGGLPIYAVYAARAGHVAVAALEAHFGKRLFESLGLPLDGDLGLAFGARTAAEWEAWARERDLPIVEVREQARRI